MSSKTVLSIGQCRPDHAAITHFLKSNFNATVLAADVAEAAWKLLSENAVHLILINRKLDADYSDGMEILKGLKANDSTADIPVMLVSNFPEWQEKAVHCGAIYGFGKAELNSPDVIDRVRTTLSGS
jgi:two-component system chemotaxis response regulator CheY